MAAGWLLAFAILLEVAGTTAMKLSAGFAKPVPSVLVFVFYFPAFVALTLALKRIDIGVAYAIWSGAGTALIAIIGYCYFQEPLNTAKFISLVLIIVGVVSLHLSGTQ